MECEIWKTINITDKVEISNFGNIRTRKNKKPRYTFENQSQSNAIYRYTQYRENFKIYTLKIHRLVAQAFIPNPENKPQVNHIDGNGLNNHVSNLEWVTPSENKLHAYAIGLQTAKGSSNSRSKLDEELVLQICMYFNLTDFTPKSACEKFGISMQQATKIRSYKAWTHVSEGFIFKPLKNRRVSNGQSKDVGSSDSKREDKE